MVNCQQKASGRRRGRLPMTDRLGSSRRLLASSACGLLLIDIMGHVKRTTELMAYEVRLILDRGQNSFFFSTTNR